MDRRILGIVIAVTVVCAVAAVFLSMRSALRPQQQPQTGGVALLLAQERQLEEGGSPLAAKAVYQKLIADFPNNRDVAQWQKKAEQLNIKILFSPVMTAQSVQYEVQPGDSLEKIAKDHKTTVELIKKSNGLAGDRIDAGMRLRVWKAPFAILVDKSANILLLKCNEELVKTYTVATGKNNSTPVGTFRIIEKIVNPPWYKDNKMIPPTSPENILGTRWMGIDKEGYGIHGTTMPESLGTQSTAGCVRMANQDVEELFSIVPQGTQVTITD